MNTKDHWNTVYETKAADDVSWFQQRPEMSLSLIQATGIAKHDEIIDVGGGTSTLVDNLLEAGFANLAVLDISAAALEVAQHRLGERKHDVEWFEADVTEFEPPRRFALWHDRAVFHFLTEKHDRQKYIRALKRTLMPNGHVIIATFATDGPLKCSGLNVARYDASSIRAELGSDFQFLEQVDEIHITPWNTQQKFSYFRFALMSAALP